MAPVARPAARFSSSRTTCAGIPDSLVGEQLSEAGAVLDGLLFRGPIAVPTSHILAFSVARNTGGEVVEDSQPGGRVAVMIGRIKFRYSIHFRPVETISPNLDESV
jgi:hypothetical protein